MNTNNSILLLDASFDPNDAPLCSLLVNVGADSFSYAIVNNKTYKVCAVFDEQECEDATAKFNERIKTDTYLSLSYQDVRIAIETQNLIAIPSELYTEADIAVHTQYFADKHITNVYTKPQLQFGFTDIFTAPTLNFTTALSDAKIFHQFAGLLHIAIGLEDTLFFNFTAGSFNVVCVNADQVVFKQSYQIAHAEEFNYYLLLIINQLNIQTANMHVLLSGIVTEGDERYNCLLKYFNSVNFLTVDEELNAEVLDDMPAHYYVNLLALYQCE